MSKIGHLFERWITLNSQLEEAIATFVPGGDPDFLDDLFAEMKDVKREVLEFLDEVGDKELPDEREAELVRILKEAYHA